MTKGLIHIVIGMLISGSLFGQKLESKVSEKSLLIGQPVTVIYSIETAKSDALVFTPKEDEIEALSITETGSLSSEGILFEIMSKFKDTFFITNDQKKWIGQYTVTAWDSGMFLIAGPSIAINDSNYVFPDISLTYYLSDPIDGVDLYDIRENYADVPPNPFSLISFLKSNWWWLALIILAPLMYWVYIKNKKRRLLDDDEEERPISLKQRTLIAIEGLEEARLWEDGRLKDHFVELSYILRSYLTSRYDISLLEKTTYEATLILTQKGLEKETIDVIMRILSQSDMVKFAKSEPDAIAILRVSTLAKQVVAETSPLDFDDAE